MIGWLCHVLNPDLVFARIVLLTDVIAWFVLRLLISLVVDFVTTAKTDKNSRKINLQCSR